MMEKKSKCGDMMPEGEKKAALERYVYGYGWDPQVVCKVFNFLYEAELTPDLLLYLLERCGETMTD
ncbi:MAG: hypothetical protein IKR51_00555 [Oscillospiraceae bacterium]|jgi:hypothetical protein|nr:hypothetical protein [Oscillospiraceae bacterium]MCR5649087.1 hypothetical protein [Oscillospiraceae bacterium]